MSCRDSKSTSTDLITSRAEDFDLAGVDAGECLALEWVAKGDDSLSSWVSAFLSCGRGDVDVTCGHSRYGRDGT